MNYVCNDLWLEELYLFALIIELSFDWQLVGNLLRVGLLVKKLFVRTYLKL